MITAIEVTWTGNMTTGSSYRALLVADATPASLELTGADVSNMNADDKIDVGSVLLTPDGTYLAYSEGVFTAKG